MAVKKKSTKNSAKEKPSLSTGRREDKKKEKKKLTSLRKKERTQKAEKKKKPKISEAKKKVRAKVEKEVKKVVKKKTVRKKKKVIETAPKIVAEVKEEKKRRRKKKEEKQKEEKITFPIPVEKVSKEEVKPKEEVVELPKEQEIVKKPKIRVNEFITVKDLAEKLQIKVSDLIKKLMSLNILATINQRLNLDTVSLITEEFGYEAEIVPLYGEDLFKEEEKSSSLLKPRPPVVTIMGHVNHGKTSLLDAIRKSKIVEKEMGNITQHIGAYKVKLDKGEIVFLDTPGHEAFTAMRARGAHITDIVVLVVAADDGIMPQTIEAIDHARAARVPIIIAINKIDLPTANVQRVKQDLANLNLVPEEWGGKTIFVEVSAKQKTGLENLLEMILLETEMLELIGDPSGPAQGTVIEAKLDPKRGILVTVLIQKGTLYLRDSFVIGLTYGKVKAMIDDQGKMIEKTTPSSPVEIMGFVDIPHTGDKFRVVKEERKARYISQMRQEINREEMLKKRQHISLEDLHQQVKEGKVEELKLIIKADVRGSVEVLKDSLEKLSCEKIKLTIIHSGVGGINEADVLLASASNALIIGFNVRPERNVNSLAEKEKVNIRTYRVIYELVADVKAAMEGLLKPQLKENSLGKVEIRQVFRVPRVGSIAGCYVREGKVLRSAQVRLLRDNVIVYEGKISSLKHFKEDVREVQTGYECGIALENFQDVKVNDIIEIFEWQEIPLRL